MIRKDPWPDFMTEGTALRILLGLDHKDRIDPIPVPPQNSKPRPVGGNNEKEKRVVGPGEFMLLTVVGSGEEAGLDIIYPSKFREEISYFTIEGFFRGWGVEEFERLHISISYLTNFRRCIFFPNEGQLRLRLDLGENPWGSKVPLVTDPTKAPLLPIS